MKSSRDQEIGPAIVLGVVLGLFLTGLLLYVVQDTPQRIAKRESYLKLHQCTVVGFYGRSGDYKVYNCMGRLVKEDELP